MRDLYSCAGIYKSICYGLQKVHSLENTAVCNIQSKDNVTHRVECVDLTLM